MEECHVWLKRGLKNGIIMVGLIFQACDLRNGKRKWSRKADAIMRGLS